MVLLLPQAYSSKKLINLAIVISACNVVICLLLLYLHFPTAQPIHGNFLYGGFAWQLDNFAITFISLTVLLAPLCLAAVDLQTKHLRYLISLILLTYSLCLGVFLARHLLVFYIFFEISLLPTFFIISFWGNKDRIRAAFFFLMYTLMGSIPLLIAIISLLYNYGTGSGNIDNIITQIHQSASRRPEEFLWWIMLLSFAIKLPVVFLHSWLPMAHTEAPTAGSMLLAGVMIKMGGYAMMRIMVPMFTCFVAKYQGLMLWMSVLSIVYGSIIIFRQTDIKKMIAYSSVAHMGYVTAGIFSLTPSGTIGALFQIFSHGLISAGLFFMIGIIYKYTGTRNIEDYGGIANICPRYSIFFVSFAMANIGLPGTSGFVGEWLTLNGILDYAIKHDFAIIALMASGMVLSSIYMLSLCKNMIFGKLNSRINVTTVADINLSETIVCSILLLLIVVLGIYPSMINNTDFVKELFQSYSQFT